MKIAIKHQLRFVPPPGTANLVMQALLTPASSGSQTVVNWTVQMPGIGDAAKFADAFGNTTHLINLLRPEGPIEITVSGLVETIDKHGIIGRPEGEPVPALYLRTTTLTKVPVTLYGKFRNQKDGTIALLHALMARVMEVLGGAEPGEGQAQIQDGQSQSQTQGLRKTSPRADAALLAHGFVGAARALDIPARFVVGYLLDQDDHRHMHCWAEAFEPGMGWIAFDPLLQLCPTTHHVRLAVGLDALSTTPLRAIPAGNGAQTLALSVSAA